MNIAFAYRYFFSHPRWAMNLLLCSVCMLIPILGNILLFGYGSDIIVSLAHGRRQDYPEFKFDHFQRYLSRGLTPFLVNLVVMIVIQTIAFILVVPLAVAVILFAFYLFDGGALAWILTLLTIPLAMIALCAIASLSIPFCIRSHFYPNFKDSFDFRFAKDFFRRTSLFTILRTIVLNIEFTILSLVGYALCFVGLYPAMVLVLFVYWVMLIELYDLYVARGGAPLPLPQLPYNAPRPAFEVVNPNPPPQPPTRA